MRKIFISKLIRKLLIIAILVYVSIIFINQQRTLDSYKSIAKYNEQKLEQERAYQDSLLSIKENIDSTEYIEQVAREKLYMYLPNERVYIDRNKQWGYLY